jgi:hypothetical protein
MESTIKAGGRSLRLMRARQSHVDDIVSLINGSRASGGEVISVTSQGISEWVSRGMSFVVIDPDTKRVVAHMAVDSWPKGTAPKSYELRSVVVAESHRNRSIHAQVSVAVIEKMFEEHPDIPLLEVKKGSKGLNLLIQGLGFTEYDVGEAQEKLGLIILRPEEGPWHAYVLTRAQYHAAKKRARDGRLADERGSLHRH